MKGRSRRTSSRKADTGASEIYGWPTPNRDQRATILVDRVGRPGVAVSIDSNNGVSRDLLILDPATGEPLAYEMVTLRNPGKLTGPFPAVQDYRLFLDHHRQRQLT